MTHVRTLIIGGGMSGLSCAYHLKRDYLLIEKSDEPGGLSRSIKQDGFVFDHTGHLLHLRNPYTLKLIPELLGDNLVLNERRAWIYSHGAYTRYPYQANLYGLPKEIVADCLKGLIDAQIKQKPPPAENSESLKSWVLRTFGDGFAKHFFIPYNQKLWTVSPEVLTAEWVAPFVPKPSLEEAITGAFSDQTKKFGYNATFYYPKEGGIQALAFAFARDLPNIRLNTSATAIDLARKAATLSTGEKVSYDILVNTAPLNRFLELVDAVPPEIAAEQKKLSSSSVFDLNLGVRRAGISDKHWVYFPEMKYRFYRVGFPMNFSTRMTPPGCSSMYVEIGYGAGAPLDEARAVQDAIRGLLECGLLKSEKEIVTRNILRIPIAYVTYDQHRTTAVERILKYLISERVHSIGRFGAWKYSYMEEAILEGKATAEKIQCSNG